jgi:hypothetical protein
MIQHKTYKLNNTVILTNEILYSHVSLFWDKIFQPIVEQQDKVKHLMVLCKVKYYDSEGNEEGYKTLGPLRRVEFKDKEIFSEYLQERLGILIDSYNPAGTSEIIFTFISRDGEVEPKDRLLLEDLSEVELPFHEFNKIKLPISMDPEDYGVIRNKELHNNYTRYIVSDNKHIYEIDVSLDKLTNKVTILGLSNFKWIDIKLDEDSFKRQIGKTTLHFLDGEVILVEKQLNAKSFKKLRSLYKYNY